MIKKYVPRVVYHPACTVFPISLEKLLHGATVKHGASTVIDDPDPNTLVEWSDSHGEWESANIVTSGIGEWDSNAPAYVQWFAWDTITRISYTLFYPGRGPRTLILEFQNGKPQRVYFGHEAQEGHLGWGMWVAWNAIQHTGDGRPTVYVGLQGSDFYPRGDNRVWLQSLVPHDYTHEQKGPDGSRILYPVPRILDTASDLSGVPIMKWDVCRYRGKWDAVPVPWSQRWLDNPEHLHDNDWMHLQQDTYWICVVSLLFLILILVTAATYQMGLWQLPEAFAAPVREHRESDT